MKVKNPSYNGHYPDFPGNPNRDKCPDPTAKKAERAMTAEEKEVDTLVRMIRQIAGWAGFEIINRIEFRCKKSGRCYR